MAHVSSVIVYAFIGIATIAQVLRHGFMRAPVVWDAVLT